ncbi:minor tail protein [Arthrobacter phage DevitoJr]|uniref:Minor tail protein n=1 Tax=Arthrobacter phage DevitoJr TaxID=2859477 RepID=A0AAE7VHT7_9CAUD|nr:minor tail protein [Arthrobacter phage DevitoJr]QXO13179.1 minor tail protein [Arthrobacter phage DevitoJr]
MATIITYNPTRTLAIEQKTVVDGSVNGSGDLILEHRDGTTFNGGKVQAPKGPTGTSRPVPAAQVMLYAGTTPPNGWMFCDGSAVSRTNFPDLFNILGTLYGAGDGSTTFNLPNLKGRVPVGLDSTQTEFEILGRLGGEKKHLLTVAEIPSHTHGVLGYSGKTSETFTGSGGRISASDSTLITFDMSTSSVITDREHNNLQPYISMNYIIALGIPGASGGGDKKPRYNTTTRRGSTAQRDGYYGVPTNDAERANLANAKVTWFNTEMGWEESYYTVTGATFLTVPGLVTGAAPGWYPTGEGPFVILDSTAPTWVDWNTSIGGYAVKQRKGGASWFTYNNSMVQILKHGRYDIRAWTQMLEGTGAPEFLLRVLASNGSTILNEVGGGGFLKNSTYRARPHHEFYDLMVAPNSQVSYRLQQGTMAPTGGMTLHSVGSPQGVGGQISVRYVGPPLVAEH